MPKIQVTLKLELDGVPYREFPLVRDPSVDVLGKPDFIKSTDVVPAFEALRELQRLNVGTFLYAEPDTRMVLRIAGQTDRGIVIEPNGFILLAGAHIEPPSPGDPLVSVQNVGDPARLRLIFGGFAAEN